MNPDFHYGPVTSENDVRSYARVVSIAFNWDPAMTARWVDDCGRSSIRVVRIAGEIVAGLQLLPLGAFFGGERLGLMGVGAVVVLPEHRGRGLGKRMMREALHEMRGAGTPLAGLFPATLPLYRSAGFERAGVRYQIAIDLKQLTLRSGCSPDAQVDVRPIDADDEPMHRAIRALYRRVAESQDGHLDREEHIWRTRIFATKCVPTLGYAFVRGSTIEGYVYFNQTAGPTGQALDIRDLVCETRGAMTRAIQFLADYRSMAGYANWMTVPEHPLLTLVNDHCFTCRLQDAWMLRIVDVAAAIHARGFAPAFSGRFTLGVDDDLIAENSGTFAVDVANGRASVTRVAGGVPDAHLDVRMLAPVFSGFQTVRSLAAAGLARCGSNPGLVDAAFANLCGSTPWLTEIY